MSIGIDLSRFRRCAMQVGATLGVYLAAIGPSLAAEAAEHGEKHSAGLPQFNPASYPSQIVWLIISFATLYILMSRKALPKVTAILEERKERLTKDIEEASAKREEAAAIMAAVEKAMSDARAGAQSEINRVLVDGEKQAASRRERLAAELNARLEAADRSIAEARSEALKQVRNAAADVARDITSRLAGMSATPAQADEAIASVMKERG